MTTTKRSYHNVKDPPKKLCDVIGVCTNAALHWLYMYLHTARLPDALRGKIDLA